MTFRDASVGRVPAPSAARDCCNSGIGWEVKPEQQQKMEAAEAIQFCFLRVYQILHGALVGAQPPQEGARAFWRCKVTATDWASAASSPSLRSKQPSRSSTCLRSGALGECVRVPREVSAEGASRLSYSYSRAGAGPGAGQAVVGATREAKKWMKGGLEASPQIGLYSCIVSADACHSFPVVVPAVPRSAALSHKAASGVARFFAYKYVPEARCDRWKQDIILRFRAPVSRPGTLELDGLLLSGREQQDSALLLAEVHLRGSFPVIFAVQGRVVLLLDWHILSGHL
ncbi:unnamed protein product [Symbiodinium microadriaticum]|nr:unnamed protein product [Symbiodinium microadriaticum]CAE7946007.1 unnamed protein product [Symbiodinium sp. KB8]